MNKLLLTISFTFLTLISYSQLFQRLPGENAEIFVKRVLQIEKLSHPIIETKEWDTAKKVIIYFVEYSGTNRYGFLGYLLTPNKENLYQRTLIDTFITGGGTRNMNIESVFFANADKDKEREIIILTKSESHSPKFADNDVDGNYYETYIYDNPNIIKPSNKLTYFKNLSEKFECFQGTIYDKKTGKLVRKEIAKFKDVESIKSALKKMGY